MTDPQNDQRLWVTMSGFVENSANSSIYNGIYRVIKSEDGGQTWVDYSEGLTQFPVNDIKYQKGSNDALYIATDVGVFYRDASMSQWECFNSNMPVNIVTDLSISECQGKIWASTYGQGMWEADLVTASTSSPQSNLFIKDESVDLGVEPNTTTQYPWLSEDIWVRNTNDGLITRVHENPEYQVGQPVYVYVRVRNKGVCDASLGTEKLKLYWAKAATALTWDSHWNGSIDLDFPNGVIAGNIVPSTPKTIPVIPPGGEQIIEMEWYPPNPADYNGINTEPWHFCLLARIEATNDPMAVMEGTELGSNVLNNNNIAWKNLTVVDNVSGIIVDGNCPEDVMQNIGVAVAVANPDNIPKTYDIEFSVPENELNDPITSGGNIIITLDNQLYEKWIEGGKKGVGFTEIQPHSTIISNTVTSTPIHDILFTPHRKLFEITNRSASFENIILQPTETHTTSLMVLYPTNPISARKEFKYDIIQKRTTNGELIGGVRYDIKKPDCSTKIVLGGSDRTINLGCSTTLTANPQLDCAQYVWFNQNGDVISRQSSLTVTPVTTTSYKLTTISIDGCISNDTVIVNVNNQLCTQANCFTDVQVSPNPVLTGNLSIAITTQESEHISITLAAAISGNVINQLTETTVPGENIFIINVTNVPKGIYAVTVRCVSGQGAVTEMITIL